MLRQTLKRKKKNRRCAFECLESRVVLSAASLGALEAMHVIDGDTAISTWEPLEVEVSPALATLGAPLLPAGNLLPIDQLPALHSNPGAPVDVYLDLNGHYQATWGIYSDALTPVYDSDGDPTTFDETELSQIYAAFDILAEDFAPFNVNCRLSNRTPRIGGRTRGGEIGESDGSS
jgi:hypothetical protein